MGILIVTNAVKPLYWTRNVELEKYAFLIISSLDFAIIMQQYWIIIAFDLC